MTYRGRFQNGVVVLEGSPSLEEGTVVTVEPIATTPQSPQRGSARAVMQNAGAWAGDPHEIDRLLDEIRRSKRVEVEGQQMHADASNPLDEE